MNASYSNKTEVGTYSLTSKATFRTIPLMRISIKKEFGIGRPGNISRESYYHRIKCSITNFLAALMSRRLLNNAALVAPTHRGPERVSNGISTQVVAWIINKWRVKIV